MKTLVLSIKPSLKRKKNCIDRKVPRDTKHSQSKSHAFKHGLLLSPSAFLLPPDSQWLTALVNAQVSILQNFHTVTKSVRINQTRLSNVKNLEISS